MKPSPDAEILKTFTPKNKLRFVTATSLFDGHDASINIMRRILQSRGAEVIHLGHNRSAKEVVLAALQEDAHAVAISSYQGGHVEYFKYVRQLLDEAGAKDVCIFGGGGGVIVPRERDDLHSSGVNRIYSPEDGIKLGLQGIIGHMLHETDRRIDQWGNRQKHNKLARAITLIENDTLTLANIKSQPEFTSSKKIPIIGITGTGGAGKSSLTDELLTRFLYDNANIKIGVICVDPSKRKTGGALLGDRIRMNSASDERVFVRSLATRDSGTELASKTRDVVSLCQSCNFDLLIVETSGIGQGDAEILKISDISVYVMTPEYGASTQLEKIDMLDFADLIAINKFERPQSLDAIRDVRTVLRRNRFAGVKKADSEYPVYGTIASRFGDDGVSGLYRHLCNLLNEKSGIPSFTPSPNRRYAIESTHRDALIPGERQTYLADIARAVKTYHAQTDEIVRQVREAESIDIAGKALKNDSLVLQAQQRWNRIEPSIRNGLDQWTQTKAKYAADEFNFDVRGKTLSITTNTQSLSGLKVPKVSLPRAEAKSEIARFLRAENVPGEFPFTSGIFPFRRAGEDPKRMFAGEGGPGRTNTRFHYLSQHDDAKRLSTAFDSVTLYGSEPDRRPDIYGKVGESGVSIAHLEDMKTLFGGFDLLAPSTSVSMTINGPAPMILAMFFNAAIEQQVALFCKKHGRKPNDSEWTEIRDYTLSNVRGTVQADILKEDQAQNTCIFSTEFALKLMGDMQEYFIRKKVRNYYSVSISGYHMAEAGCNPISQLAFTLANGFTYVEYYLARGMKIDDFAPNLSFFFSNGLDPEYSVLGRVARRIWSIAMRDYYRGNDRSQRLKYHIQTSGRSLHAMEIDFNDIRTTLQALIALYDNCNSLHTNAYDEAITTPTEESVRRALAIQMIINREFGANKCENVNQGSYFIDELTDLVETAVLAEFERLSTRGGVLGAMERQYQRMKIQEESLHYETLKDNGELPIIGVNTFMNPATDVNTPMEIPLARASYEEKDAQLDRLKEFHNQNNATITDALERLSKCVLQGGNIFEELMDTTRVASLGQITESLFKVGGQYRRSM